MFRLEFDMKPTVQQAQRISAQNVVRVKFQEFDKDWVEKGNPPFDFNNPEHIEKFKESVERNTTLNLRQEINGEVSYSKINRIKLTTTRSNLGKGFIFWFLCNLCGRRTKYLYIPRFSEIQACRMCHKLTYYSQRNNDSKYFKKFLGGRI